MPTGTLIFDVETHSADLLYSMPPEEFVRLIGYKWAGDEEVTITTDLEELKAQILKARYIIGHNIHAFDLKAVFGHKSDIPLQLTMEKRVFDTWVHAVLVNPAPETYVNRKGKKALAKTPEQARKWYSLDEQAYQLGVPGKTDDIKALAREFGGFGEIPVDEPRYREYLVGDVLASERVAQALMAKRPIEPYDLREQEIAARAAIISSNGWRVDVPRATARVEELAARREEILSTVREKYGLPETGKSPWASKAGKEAIFAALADHGITPEKRKDWPLTKTGNPSLGGEALIMLTEGTPAEDLGRALAELKGQRSLAQLALDSVHPDGFAHPNITMLQRSGRWSTTEPGLTVWTARGPGAIEKQYFIADTSDDVLLEFDYSNADARVVASLSGDKEYAKRFEPGADGHMINAIAAWGEAVVATDPKGYRQRAKVPGHGWGYRVGARTLSRQTGMEYTEAKKFLDNMNKRFSGVVRWQDRCVQEAHRNRGFVMNLWGRRMPVEKDRAFTQAPALHGQSGTREIVCDAILRMPIEILRRVKAQIHDAIVFSVPRIWWREYRDTIIELMSGKMNPPGGLYMEFPVESGEPADNWYQASH